jgi:alkylation response protein AidB-like acyl-CoA dehydrogenase
VILMYGTEAQKQLVRGILSADDIWCQGFSEPGAGSDLASLQTRALEQPDGSWRVTGHKVWTTLAHVARYMILLARTDASAPKYRNLTFFLFPMQGAGVTVQPLIKLTGEGGFNQVLFEDAPMPADAVLGKKGAGWEVAMATLMFERGASGEATESVSEYLEVFDRLVALAKRTPREGARAIDDAVLRDRMVQLRIELEALALASPRARTPELAGERPMALPLMNKLVFSEINQRLTNLACEMLGPDVAYWRGDPAAPDRAQWPRAYLNSFGLTIGGGTSEVLRNILAERILGLPKGK